MYSRVARFDWDARKSSRNLRERNFDFEFATLVFEGLTLEREDSRRDTESAASLPLAGPMESR